jgi:hypothetical protein
VCLDSRSIAYFIVALSACCIINVVLLKFVDVYLKYGLLKRWWKSSSTSFITVVNQNDANCALAIFLLFFLLLALF